MLALKSRSFYNRVRKCSRVGGKLQVLITDQCQDIWLDEAT